MFALQTIAALFAQAGAEIPDEMGYVWAAYGLTIGLLVAYAVFTIRRGRSVGKKLPPGERRWM